VSNVVIFDSGVGGLSIYQAVHSAQAVYSAQAAYLAAQAAYSAQAAHDAQAADHTQPKLDYVFVSDNQAFPYGTKDESELIERVVRVVTTIAERYDPQILVVACNTASTVVLPILRKQFGFPIVGVVPAVKPAALLSKTRHMALLATPATIKRPYTDKLIADYASDCQVLKLGSSKLVELAEKKLYGEPFDLSILQDIVKPVLDQPSIDVLVLACTHFPLLRDELEQVFRLNEHSITLVDSTQGIANRVSDLVKSLPSKTVVTVGQTDAGQTDVDQTAVSQMKQIATFTSDVCEQTEYVSQLKLLGFDDIQTLPVVT